MIKKITMFMPNGTEKIHCVGEDGVQLIIAEKSEVSIDIGDGAIFYGGIPYIAVA